MTLLAQAWRDLSASAVVAGFVAVLVGFTSSVAIVFAAAQALGATPAQTTSWIWALGIGMGLTSIGLSLAYRQPVLTAWSTPGAALLAATSGLAMPEAVGAFVVCALLIVAAGVMLNYVGLTLSRHMESILFLDMTGTALVALDVPGKAMTAAGEAVGRAGFTVKRVDVVGLKNMDSAPVYEVALEQRSMAMPLVDVAGVRQKLLRYGWIKDARVSRRLPDTLVVDMPPGTGDVQLSLVQKSRPDGAVIVSTPQALSLIDATRAVDLFRKVSVPVLGLVENMSGFVCPHCGEQSDPFGSGGAEDAAKELGIPFLGRIPLDSALREASDAGAPPAAGDGPQSRIFVEIAARLLEAMETAGG